MKQTLIVLAAVTVAFVLAMSLLGHRAAASVPEQARPAWVFLDTIGIGAGLSFNPPFPCADYTKEKAALTALGVRHIRSGETGPVAIAAYQDLANSGIKTMLCEDANYGVRPDSTFWINAPGSDSAGWGDPSPGYVIHDFLIAAGPGTVVDSVEMPNEIDCAYSRNSQYWHPADHPKSHISADPKSPLYWVNYIVAATKASYTAIKSDPATAMVSVVGPSLGGTYRIPVSYNPIPAGSLYSYTDYGCIHPYLGWNDPDLSTGFDSTYYPANYQTPFATSEGKRPLVASETGYPTGAMRTSDAVQAKYIPRLYCEAYLAGYARTFVYCLFDNGSGTFGLLHSDFSPKPAYTALKNFLGVLNDTSAPFTPGSLSYTLAISPVNGYKDPLTGAVADYGTGRVHHMLLQKRDRSFYLVLWNEVSDQKGSFTGPYPLLSPPALPATITLPASITQATLYTLGSDGAMTTAAETILGGKLSFKVRDTVEVLRFR